MSDSVHIPVMLEEVLTHLSPVDGETYVDGTFGAGGYSSAILKAAPCHVFGVDRDPDAEERAADFSEEHGGRFTFLRGNFSDVEALLSDVGAGRVDGFVLDLGVSSYHFDEAGRGFSFRFDGPLDMRMDTRGGKTAADIVNEYSEEDLASVIYKYGEERKSRRIAKKIVERRAELKFETTFDLAEIVRGCLPKSFKDKSDPATRTFQALRIAVNDELSALEKALKASLSILKPGGRLVVVTFHSLEDRMVKTFLRERSGLSAGQGSRYLPVEDVICADFKILTRKAVAPSPEEIERNPRSRSAKLRAAVRLGGEGAS
jgi:16S rRNA (cytosine1402-N4)-methyltransferase